MSECDKCIRRSWMVLQTLFGPDRKFMTCDSGHELFVGNCADFDSGADSYNSGLTEINEKLKARINRLRIYAETAWTARKRDGSLDNPDYRLYADWIIDDLCDESPAPDADLERENAELRRQLLESQSEARQSEYRRRRTAESATGQIRKIEYLEELLSDNKQEIEELKSELIGKDLQIKELKAETATIFRNLKLQATFHDAKAAEDAGQADGFELGCRLPLMTADESRRLYEELLADKNRKIEALESELIGKECDILEMTETLDAHFSLIRQALKMLAMLDPAPESEGGADV